MQADRKGNGKVLFMVWNARLLIESEFGEFVRVVRCQRLLMFEHFERLDGGLNDAPGICAPRVCHGKTNIS